MNQKIKHFVLLIFIFTGLLCRGKASLILAQYGPYGEEAPSGQISVDKKIKNPEAGKGELNEFVDNLGPQEYLFSPGEKIYFKIRVQNTGETTFEKVEVKDILPLYVKYISGSIEIEYQNLRPDEFQEFEIVGEILSADELPDGWIFCGEPKAVNKVIATAGEQSDEDIASFCIEKEILSAAVQPEAGVNIIGLGLGFLVISLLGLLLEKNRLFLKVRKGH